jgi:hypothetical protein
MTTVRTVNTWHAGVTWVFQGTVLEDGTAGTHVTSLTITPGQGSSIQLLYGSFIAGAGAANLVTIGVDDGTNLITQLTNGLSLASGEFLMFPSSSATGVTKQMLSASLSPMYLTGTMRFFMRCSTATTGLTQTFACAWLLRGTSKPTATLADSVGVPTLTTNTNAVFG